MVKDPDLLKQLTVKDFDYFIDHLNVFPEEESWSKNLFSLKGQAWKDMRATLSPAFTSSKMRAMFTLMDDCATSFVGHLEKTSSQIDVLNMKDLFTRYANDVIATCAFGITVNSLEERENEFYKMGKIATDFGKTWNMIKITLYIMMPKLIKLLGLQIFDERPRNFFRKIVEDTVKLREENNIIRPDMIHILMEARKGTLNHIEDKENVTDSGFATVEESHVGKASVPTKKEITVMDMTAQVLIFFFAGFDSVSTLMCYMAQELAMHPDIQQRLREEVDTVLANNDGKVNYDSLSKMQYMDMVISESLRLWPITPLTDRLCVKPYKIVAERPDEKTFTIEKGDMIWVPIMGFHRDPEYFPNPTKFDPERFNADNRKNIKPYTYMPFGVGPRNCIASRFALMEAKTIFVHLLSKFELEVVEKTQVPIVITKNSFSMVPEKGFWLGLKKRLL